MFAKVFEQIYDSSIAEDYNCRRMFMDLLVLADPTGCVDMTHEAIARRTNVPFMEVFKYVEQLCQPDPKSRSKMEEGKRLVPLDKHRDWGWKIVNYQHYRQIKDEEARRSYFRDQKRKDRAKKKKAEVQEEVEEGVKCCSTLSNDVQLLSKTMATRFEEWMQVRRGMGKAPKSWEKMFSAQIKWLTKFSEPIQVEILSASIRNNWQGLFEPKTNGQKPTFKPTFKPKYLPAPANISDEELAKKREEVRKLSAEWKAQNRP